MNIFKRFLVFLLIIGSFCFASNFLLAQSPDIGMEYPRDLGLGGDGVDVRDALVNVVKLFLTFLGIIATVLIMYAGWLWMTSGGEPAKIQKAKSTLINAIIGLIIIFSAFMIVTWIVNNWDGGSGGGSSGGGGETGGGGGGIGVIGSCVINTVYPEPNQKEVPRNTSIIVTFKEEIDPVTICGNNVCDGTQNIIKENIRIFKTTVGDSCVYDSDNDVWINCENTNIKDVKASSNDNKTFVFSPVNYLGSPSEYIDYSVYLSGEILKKDANPVFKTCRTDFFQWSFEVSNKLDLTPPQVISGGIIPDADNEKDLLIPAQIKQAKGELIINSVSAKLDASYVNIINNGGSPSATIDIYSNCNQSGNLEVSIVSASSSKFAKLKNGNIALGSVKVDGKIIDFGGYLKLTLASDASVGNSWTINGVKSFKEADKIKIGDITYVFVKGTAVGNEVLIGANNNETANNLNTIINNTHPEVKATVLANKIELTAKIGGVQGNSIVLEKNTDNIVLSGAYMTGGVDSVNEYETKDSADEPINTIVQINFNEAINPLNVSGESTDVANYIRVKKDDGTSLSGKFKISNLYKTVEFIPNNACGFNACGEEIYCLPGDSKIIVELVASTLDGCNNCEARTPFNSCNNGHCYDPISSIFYPFSSSLDGIIDLANNSLDGNRIQGSQGPVSFYNENISTDTSNGDNYTWSFYTNNVLDIVSPSILSIEPTINQNEVDLEASVELVFDKVMLSSSLATGEVVVNNKKEKVTHKLLNLWSLAEDSFGYWIVSENIDIDNDGGFDQTKVEIKHTKFGDNFSQKAQAGSGIKDIRQNCYRPSVGPDNSGGICVGPSCCDGVFKDKENCD